MSIQYLVVAALAVGFLTHCRSVVYNESEKGVGVYPLAKSTELRSDPQISDKRKGATVSLAEPLVIQKTTGDGIHVTTPDMSKSGWIHRGAVTYSEKQAEAIKESPCAPTNVVSKHFLHCILPSAATLASSTRGEVIGDRHPQQRIL